jgi:hypothetical protein
MTFEDSTIVLITWSAKAEMKSEPLVQRAAQEDDLLSTQAREFSAGIATFAEAILGALDPLARKHLWSMSKFANEPSATLCPATHTAGKLVRKQAVKRGGSLQDLVRISRHDALFQSQGRVWIGILEQLSPAEREITLSSTRRLPGLGQNQASTQRIESE